MKERIGKIVIVLFLLFGIVFAIALAETYLPTWLYWTIAGILLVWFLYDVSKPDDCDFHQKVERLNDLIILREYIGKKYCSDKFIELKNKIDEEQERIIKSIKL